MLYVFHVDTGNMMTLDMSLTTESVQTLKEYVEKAFKIPADKQVLLISGGECLDSTKRVCSYSSGTDTNPIYLFSKSMHDIPYSQASVLDFREEEELLEKERKYSELPPSFQTVTKRAQLAQQFSDSASHLLRTCEGLVSDQHNQHQGWAAVVANFEDVLAEFKCQFSQLESDFIEYLRERELFMQFLERFRENLQVLRKIPMLSKLLQTTEDHTKYLMQTSQTSEATSHSNFEDSSESSTSLFDWIGKDDHDNDLESMYHNCVRELMRFNQEKFNNLCADVATALNAAEQPMMKEIRGLGPRLFSLDKLIQDAKKKVQEQNDLALSVTKNQSRVQNLKDSSILPDLCASHIKQLVVMSDNHKALMNSREVCSRAKVELNKNLNTRLQWVIHTQNSMQKSGVQIEVFSENIARLRYQLGILEQVDMAPVAYLSSIAEIVRRRSFSQNFLVWASELACRLLTIHNEEVARRKEFQSKFEDHFIQALFPGMKDLPPGYGIRAPSYFDTGLPKLTLEDVEFMKKELPELAEYLNISDSSDQPYFTLFKSILTNESEKIEERTSSDTALKDIDNQEDNLDKSISKEKVRESSLIAIHGLPHLKDLDRGCESETDTEEFEKVGQSPLELNFDKDMPSPRPGTQDASTLTEDNLEISRSEYDKLKSLLIKMSSLAAHSLVQLKSELNNLKSQYSVEKEAVSEHLQKVYTTYENLCSEQVNREKQLINKMIADHSNEINDFRKLAQVKNEEIKSLRTNNLFLENKVKKTNEELACLKEKACKNDEKRAELENQVVFVELEKERCLRELSERLNREHRDEIKTLQARFKLMTMERTPSEGNLEKALEFSSLTNHESIISQMTENFEMEKEKAVKETMASETDKWLKEIDKLKEEFEVEKNSLLNSLATRINEEKDKQIEVLRCREEVLMDDIKRYTSTIDQLSNAEIDDHNLELMDKIETLEIEKSVLNLEILKMKNEKVDMAASVGSCQEGKTDSATSPIKQRKSLTKSLSISSSGKAGKVSIDSLKQGDYVVVVWDENHENFKIVQNSSVMYFLHSDSIQALNLEVVEGSPKKPNLLYCLGEYVDREYCYARKSENRYKVPKGTRFFRVKVKPLERGQQHQSSLEIDIPMTQSHSASHRTSSASTTEPEFHFLPSSPKLGAKLSGSEADSETTEEKPSEIDNKTYFVDDDSPYTTAVCEFARNNEFSEEPVSSSSDVNDFVRTGCAFSRVVGVVSE